MFFSYNIFFFLRSRISFFILFCLEKMFGLSDDDDDKIMVIINNY